MSIKNASELKRLRESGRIVREAIDAMRRHARAGATTAEINAVGAEVIRRNGARSAPMLVYDFPAEVCISVNDEIVHGIPSGRVLAEGDLLKLDVTVEKDGLMADAAVTVGIGRITEQKRRLITCVERALTAALSQARTGNRVNDIGRAVAREAAEDGFRIVRDLTGHGIGRTIHEAPRVPNYDDPHADRMLTKGLVIAVEPIMAIGTGAVRENRDGWTISTADGSAAAHCEHTIVVTDGDPIVLTA